MKTHKINFKILWGTIAICLAVVFSSIFFGVANRKTARAAAPNFNTDIYSTGFTGVMNDTGLIFNIEKVAVDWGADVEGQPNQTTQRLTDEDAITLAGDGTGKEIYFKPIKRDGLNRYAVADGEYVMLDKDSGITSNGQTLDETIVISFGQYYFDGSGGVGQYTGENGAGIDIVSNIEIKYEGQLITSNPSGFNFGEVYQRSYQTSKTDFAYVLPKGAPEGRYTITLPNFMYGGENYGDEGTGNATFEFILIKEAGYIDTVEEYESENEGANKNIYTVKPTLTIGTNEAHEGGSEGLVGENNKYTYTLGSSKNYPTLTYDYTRYKLNYTYYGKLTTTTGATTNYDVSFNFDRLNPILNIVGSRVDGLSSTDSYNLTNYTADSAHHLVTLVFTEAGDYNFSFNYIYIDKTANTPSVINNMPNLTVENIGLSILGVEDFYLRNSETDETTISANVQFKYIKFAAQSQCVDLIVPAGYTLRSQPVANKIYYTTNATTAAEGETIDHSRVGNTIESESLDTNLGQTIRVGESQTVEKTANEWAEVFNANKTAANWATDKDNIKAFIDDIDYAKLTTNLGSVRFRANYDIDYTKSFYFKADDAGFVGEIFNAEDNLIINSTSTEENVQLANKTTYNETTFLNKPGYYLVFINIKDGSNNGGGSYHIFAYRYNQDLIKAQVTVDGVALRADGYTNKEVNVNWALPGVFEQDVVVKYATSTTSANEVTSADDYAYGEYSTLDHLDEGVTLGRDVTDGEFLHYKVEISCKGVSSETYTFTVDKSNITDVGLYAVGLSTNSYGNQTYNYIWRNGERVRVDNKTHAITNTSFALDWQAKPSGAKISAKYVYVPIVFAGEESGVGLVYGNDKELLTNNYSANFEAAQVRSFAETGLRVVDQAGIYLFELTDDAGNQTKMAFVLDNTPAYLAVADKLGSDNRLEEPEFLLGQMKTYSAENVYFTSGTHKAISLKNATEGDSEDINALVKIINNNYTDKYCGEKNAATELFTTQGENTYLIVKNTNVFAYDGEEKLDNNTSFSVEFNKHGTMSYVKSASTSMVRRLYVIGENDAQATTSNSYAILEINLDNSRGEAYFYNTRIDLGSNGITQNENYTFDSSKRLNTGSDVKGEAGEITQNGVTAANATRDDFVYFTWVNGSADTEVGKISYKHYSLNVNGEYNPNKFYYQSSSQERVIYENKDDGTKTYAQYAGSFNGGANGYALINLSGGRTADGLYEITRTYKGKGTDTDPQTLNYYFIVDRNNIINLEGNIGTGISFGLFDDGLKFKAFNSPVSTASITYTQDAQSGVTNVQKTKTYPVYLQQDATLKLPATINVPIAKYFNSSVYAGEQKTADYYANNLYVAVYFVDRFLQLPSNYNNGNNIYSKLLFEYNSKTQNEQNSANWIENGYFKIDLTQMQDSDLQERFIHTEGENSWLTLPGDYVVIISDNTLSAVDDLNTQLIGLRINLPNADSGARVDVNLYDDGALSSSTQNYTIHTNKQDIEIVIPALNDEGISAQTAQDNLEIKRIITDSLGREQTTTFECKNTDITINNNLPDFITISRNEENNSISVKLNCNNAQNQNVRFEISVRWQSSWKGSTPKFEHSYYYYINGESEPKEYFERTYIIYVDLAAPSENINNLLNTDNLLNQTNFYNKNEIFVDSELGGNQVKVYPTFDGGNADASKIYAFRVGATTPFNTDDVENVYCKKLQNFSDVNLMSLSALSYSNQIWNKQTNSPIDNYGALLQLVQQNGELKAGYYEIVEQDAAGNLSQYVVFFYANANATNYITNLQMQTQISNDGDEYSTFEFSKQNSTSTQQNTLNIYGANPLIENDFSLQDGDVFDRFYVFELYAVHYDGSAATANLTGRILTNLTTQFNATGLCSQVINMFKSSGNFAFGSYRLDVYNAFDGQRNSFFVNLYGENNYRIDAKDLVDSSRGYEINFSRAKKTDDATGQLYMANTIRLVGGDEYVDRTFVYISKTDDRFGTVTNDYYEVWQNDGGLEYDENPTYILSGLSGKYILIVTTGNNVSSYPFDTSGSTEFYNIDSLNSYFDQSNNVYYTFNDALITYNTTIYSLKITYSVNGGNNQNYEYDTTTSSNLNIFYSGTTIISVDNQLGRVEIFPYFKNEIGALLEVKVELIYKSDWGVGTDGMGNQAYNLVADTRTAEIAIMDADGTLYNNYNFNFNPSDITLTRPAGTMDANGNLYLKYTPQTEQTPEGLNYVYQLYVEEDTGELSAIGESGNKMFTISPTNSVSGNIYRFIIYVNYVRGGQANFLGSVEYTFLVVQGTGVYTPFDVTLDGETLRPNAGVYVTLADIIHDTDSTEDTIKRQIAADIHDRDDKINAADVLGEINLPQGNIEIYIKNTPIVVYPSGNYNNFGCYHATNTQGYDFYLYRLDKDGVEYYIATLIVSADNNNFISLADDSFVYDGVYLAEQLDLKVKNNNYSSSKIIPNLNTVFVSVSHYDNLVFTKPLEYSNTNGEAGISITGSGRFNVKFIDLAGNTNIFTFNELNNDVDSLMFTILNNDVPVLVNNQAPINKALYNGEVTISIPSREVYAKLNADVNALQIKYRYNNPSADEQVVSYTTIAENGAYSYTFTNPGWYSVVIVCPFTQTEGELRTVLEFTIIEPSEAYSSYTFGKERAEQIVRVTNRDNMTATEIANLTNTFKEILLLNEYKLDYTTIVSAEYVDRLGIGTTYGRQQFNITYRVNNGIYPVRDVNFTISLNNAIPNIECSLASGEGSTKGFTISYNLGEIYNQVGASAIYVYKGDINNDNAAVAKLEVNQQSANEIASTKISRRGDGSDGNYYIVLKTASGRIVSSYGVKITQPLNTWAIVVIVVVAIIVVAIIVAIVLLRTKMRIR